MSEPTKFEVLGYFEQLYDPATRKIVGLRDIQLGDRVVGFAGEKEIVVSGTIEVRNGHRTQQRKFKVPTKLLSTVFPVNGRRLAALPGDATTNQ